MTRTGTINNALNMRGLQELPPPICGNYVNKHHLSTRKLAEPALLHQAYVSCGRVFSCLSLRVARNGEAHINY